MSSADYAPSDCGARRFVLEQTGNRGKRAPAHKRLLSVLAAQAIRKSDGSAPTRLGGPSLAFTESEAGYPRMECSGTTYRYSPQLLSETCTPTRTLETF